MRLCRICADVFQRLNLGSYATEVSGIHRPSLSIAQTATPTITSALHAPGLLWIDFH
jgi:hypothetical protein